MKAQHVIRLRGPWTCQPLARFQRTADGEIQETTDDLPASRTVVLPSAADGPVAPHFFGRVRFVRRFGRPTGLESDDQVWLSVDRVDSVTLVTLNGQSIGRIPPGEGAARIEIAGRLQERNELLLDVARYPDDKLRAGGWVGQVRIEISPGL